MREKDREETIPLARTEVNFNIAKGLGFMNRVFRLSLAIHNWRA